jgi:PleD family two-component response regulator
MTLRRSYAASPLLRAADFAGRNGGEEFALLLPNTEIFAAAEIAERVRIAIADGQGPVPPSQLTEASGM